MDPPNLRQPSVPELLQQAQQAYRAGDWAGAERRCRAILRQQPAHFDTLTLLAAVAAHAGHPQAAAELFGSAAAVEPGNPAAHLNYANALQLNGRHAEALHSYQRALQLQPDDFEANLNCGNVQQKLGQFEVALDSYAHALRLRPDDATVHLNRGVALSALKRFEEALASYQHSLRLDPANADAHINCGNALRRLRRFEAALDSYQRALSLRPDADAYLNCGLTLTALKRHEAALASYDRALQLKPDFADAYNSRGVTLHERGRFAAALADFARAQALQPRYADAYNNQGITLQRLQRLPEALQSYARAVQLDPGFAEAYLNRGNVLRELGQPEAALQSYATALRINPAYAAAYSNNGQLLLELGKAQEAVRSYEQALRLDPDADWLRGSSLHARMYLCAWQEFEPRLQDTLAQIALGARAAPPFALTALVDSSQHQRRAAETWSQAVWPASNGLPSLARRPRGRKIRLGYYSSDFHEHATTHLMAELFETHDRARFELSGFSYGSTSDGVTQRVAAAFDRFVDVRTMSDEQVVQLSRELEIDIAVDLKGHTRGARTGIFAHRAAPIQVNYLGYPGTMGAGYFDYIIADPVLIPEAQRSSYCERICYLPDSYQANRRLAPGERPAPLRAELGLPATGFVFCCFNNVFKILPVTFGLWMSILQQVEGSVLWLLVDDDAARDNLRREASARGVSATRLVFAARQPFEQHLARHAAADLFLDTSPYNAHTTASDALRCGLPVITCAGESFAARVATSLLTAVGLPELATPSPQHYAALAVQLATTPQQLAQLRARLRHNLESAALFDTGRFARQLEDGYGQMYERYHRGTAPDHLFIKR
jgi:protein O-GlcNAc transferase